MNSIRLARTAYGYTFTGGGHTYTIAKERTDYGDEQWIIDRDGRSAWAGCRTLAGVRATIAAAITAGR